MRKFSVYIFVIVLFSSCATIVSKSTWPFSVDTHPSGAKVVITNKKGKEIFRGRTPTAMRLKSGAGFFAKESYVVTLSMDGFETTKINVECKINGWYFGNIVFGGLLGLLIIDPATGAMFKLADDGISEELKTLERTTGPALKILDKAQVPENWEKHLVRIN